VDGCAEQQHRYRASKSHVNTSPDAVRESEPDRHVLLTAKTTGLPKDSVANVSHIVTLDRSLLTDRAGRLTPKQLAQVLHGVDIVLGR
jgi:mRNA interferase MazF